MLRRFAAIMAAALCCLPLAGADDLAAARALDREISKFRDISDASRGSAIANLARRIRRQPPKYAMPLALNLATVGTEGSGDASIQVMADTIVATLPGAPAVQLEGAYTMLAALARYYRARVAVDDPRYTNAMRAFEAEDSARRGANFTLTDLNGRPWTLSSLRGKVVLVNFWATWCPPCRIELPDLKIAQDRFKQDLVILAISGEPPATVRSFAAQQKLGVTVLLDPGDRVKQMYRVGGIPASFVYDRTGKIVAQALARPGMPRLMRMLSDAGLR